MLKATYSLRIFHRIRVDLPGSPSTAPTHPIMPTDRVPLYHISTVHEQSLGMMTPLPSQTVCRQVGFGTRKFSSLHTNLYACSFPIFPSGSCKADHSKEPGVLGMSTCISPPACSHPSWRKINKDIHKKLNPKKNFFLLSIGEHNFLN